MQLGFFLPLTLLCLHFTAPVNSFTNIFRWSWPIRKKWYLSHTGLPFELFRCIQPLENVLYNMRFRQLLSIPLFPNMRNSTCIYFFGLRYNLQLLGKKKSHKMSFIVGTVADRTYFFLCHGHNWQERKSRQQRRLFVAVKPRFVPLIWLFFALVLNHNGTVNWIQTIKKRNVTVLHPNVCLHYWVGWQRRS